MKHVLRSARQYLAHNLNPAADGVHFHTGPAGQAYPCHDAGCASPHRDPNE